jgi:hypothetical protein
MLMYSCSSGTVPTAKPYTAINLHWIASPTPGVTYNLYRSQNNGAYSVLAKNIIGLIYKDASISRKTEYCYIAKSFNGTTESVPSLNWCITTN